MANQPDIKELYAQLQSKIQDCITWKEKVILTTEGFMEKFKNEMHIALRDNNTTDISNMIKDVDAFMKEHNIPAFQFTKGGHRRRKPSSSSHFHRRRSSQKRHTQRKQKRRQCRGSRRA